MKRAASARVGRRAKRSRLMARVAACHGHPFQRRTQYGLGFLQTGPSSRDDELADQGGVDDLAEVVDDARQQSTCPQIRVKRRTERLRMCLCPCHGIKPSCVTYVAGSHDGDDADRYPSGQSGRTRSSASRILPATGDPVSTSIPRRAALSLVSRTVG